MALKDKVINEYLIGKDGKGSYHVLILSAVPDLPKQMTITARNLV
jgi:hypothetical protein